jgi:putative membrane protein
MIHHYLQTLLPFLLWLGLSGIYTAVFAGAYLWLTPQHELELIRDGNASAAICLGGTLLGYVLPLASAMVHGVDLIDFAIWAFIAMLVQLAVYLVMRLAYRGLTGAIIANHVSVAIIAASISVASGILNAAAMFE